VGPWRSGRKGSNLLFQGLPAYGVILSGSPENPMLEHHSGRVVIPYDVRFSDANGRGMPAERVMAGFRAAGGDS
jgi:hypothetical protein